MTSASARITDVAWSAVWTQPVPEAFAAAKGDLAFISQGPLYRAAINSGLRSESGVPGDVDFPWPRIAGQGFWAPYLGRRTVEGLSGEDAWARLLPVRLKISQPDLGSDIPGRLLLEAFVAPGGIAVVAGYRVRETFTLSETVALLAKVRNEIRLQFDLGGRTVAGLLPDVAQRLIEHLARERVGVWPLGSSGARDPFIVCTVISARDLGLSPRVVAGAALERTLNGIASWSPTWKRDPLPKLQDVTIARSTKPSSHVVYVRDRGRVVWFPGLFGLASRTRHTLSCYHRNQTLLAMTLDSAADLLRAGEADMADGRRLIALPPGYRQSLRHAADGIHRAATGADDSYKSRVSPRQLEANGGLRAYAALAEKLEVPALPLGKAAAP